MYITPEPSELPGKHLHRAATTIVLDCAELYCGQVLLGWEGSTHFYSAACLSLLVKFNVRVVLITSNRLYISTIHFT